MADRPKTTSALVATGLTENSSQLRQYQSFAEQFKRWQKQLVDCLDNELANHCRVVRIKGDTLIVSVSSAAWATRLKFQQGAIITHFSKDATIAPLRHVDIRIHPEAFARQEQQKNDESDTAKRLRKLAEGSTGALREQLLALAERAASADKK
ncbi:hypothetical protein CWI84_07165 [Idiomarina tyrosinivorans]|uniref:DUF721 domain-containing protein n=1 Tax=Idiomarina tyrosinivorans TaxID=1445662 RepID=A0A432ZQB9_9GAMM|nr:DciA family protein [Idiomarina tyrosinivorans]RUO80073.1 hypothetical protein CWI84_07165 [Idiomarina tyrosinivorans]